MTRKMCAPDQLASAPQATTEAHQSAITDHMNNLNHIHVPDCDSAKWNVTLIIP